MRAIRHRHFLLRWHHQLSWLLPYVRAFWPLSLILVAVGTIFFLFEDHFPMSVDDQLWLGGCMLLGIALFVLVWYVYRLYLGTGYLLMLQDQRARILLTAQEKWAAWFTIVLVLILILGLWLCYRAFS